MRDNRKNASNRPILLEISKQYVHAFATLESLLKIGHELSSFPLADSPFNGLVTQSLVQNTNAASSVEILSQNGYGSEASVIARTILESTINAHYLKINASACTAYIEFSKVQAYKHYRAMKDKQLGFNSDDQERLELLQPFYDMWKAKEKQEKNWTSIDLYSRVIEIDKATTDPSQKIWQRLYEIVYRAQSSHSHRDHFSSMVGGPELTVGPSIRLIGNALSSTILVFEKLLVLFDEVGACGRKKDVDMIVTEFRRHLPVKGTGVGTG